MHDASYFVVFMRHILRVVSFCAVFCVTLDAPCLMRHLYASCFVMRRVYAFVDECVCFVSFFDAVLGRSFPLMCPAQHSG